MKPTQDSMYWPLEPLKVVSFWLALDDVNQGFLSLVFCLLWLETFGYKAKKKKIVVPYIFGPTFFYV